MSAAPADPFSGASPSFDPAPEEGTDYNVGDWGVSEQRGAATYTYPIDVPPGRNGMAPSLALHYSSQSPLRGGIAVGWSLDFPRIDLDTALGTEVEPVYKASFRASSGRLIETAEDSPYPGRAYRIDFDESFTRFFHSTPGELDPGPKGWVAFTTDGVKHFFEEQPDATDYETQWRITRQVDPFGNIVKYHWSAVVGPNGPHEIDYSLARIEYTVNEDAGLDAHAKVEFEYAPLEVCGGSNIPIGAAVSDASPTKVHGAERLTAIETYVRDEPGGAWRLSKQIDLTYELGTSRLHEITKIADPPPPAYCALQNRLRYLTEISVTAYDQAGNSTALPPTTFTYNHRINTTRDLFPGEPDPLAEQTISTPGYAQRGDTHGAITTLLDLDSDGVRDRVSVTDRDGMCVMIWQRGLLGGAFEETEQTSLLPTTPWYDGTAPDPDKERCTLNGQIVYRSTPDGLLHKGIVGYHFLDYTGDGRVDLLTHVWASEAHDEFAPPNLSPVRGAGKVPNSTPVSVPDPQPGDTALDPMTPEEGGDLFYKPYTWRLFTNIGDPSASNYGLDDLVFSDYSMEIIATIPLTPNTSDVSLDTSVLAHYSIAPLIDIDGDGFLDVIDVTVDPSDYTEKHLILGQGDWTVYRGQGGSTLENRDFEDRDTALDWHVPAFDMAVGTDGTSAAVAPNGCGFNQKSTIARLVDINGNGRLDLLVQRAGFRLKAYLNDGTGFEDTPLDLNTSSPIESIQTDLLAAGIDIIRDGNRGYRRRMLDLDGDGLLDMMWLPNCFDDGKTDVFGVGLDGQWRYSSGGDTYWRNLETSSVPLADLRFGDFDGDGRTDVFSIGSGGQWRYSSGGTTQWINLTTSNQNLTELAFGDFDGDGRTDVFNVGPGGQWRYSSGGTSGWINLRVGYGLSGLSFGDFDGDGKTDVFWTGIYPLRWYYSSGGLGDPIPLNAPPGGSIAFGDFDGDGKTDVFNISGNQWRYASGGLGDWINLTTANESMTDLRFGDFDGDGKTDVFNIGPGGQWRYSSGGATSWRNLAVIDANIEDLRFGNFDDDITAEHKIYARFNLGDRFGSQVELPVAWQKTKRLLSATDGNWQLETDFIDVTGDGLSDLVRWNDDSTLAYVDRPGLSYAPDLLNRVENGRGMRVDFSYAPTSDADVVGWTGLTSGGPALPSIRWVVDEIRVAGGHGTPQMTTRYSYRNPQLTSPTRYTGIPEPHRFAGFGVTTVTTYRDDDSPARRATRAYDYALAPDGRVTREWVYRAEEGSFHLHKYTEQTWQQEGRAVVHLDTRLTRTCTPEMTESECEAQTETLRRYQETWAPDSGLYVKRSSQRGTGLAENEGDRRTSYVYHVRNGQPAYAADDYRIMVEQITREQAYLDGTGIAFAPQSRTGHTFDTGTGLPVLTTVWQGENTPANTERTFDPLTGNLLTETKPEQQAAGGSGNRTTYGYDAHQLFVQTITNELGHQLSTTRDIATGAIVERSGPNFVLLPTLPSGQTVWERETWQIDGFGRVLEHAISVDDETEGYVLHTVDRMTYFDGEQPYRVREEHRRDFDTNDWVTSDRSADGLGRVLTETLYLDDGETAVTSYTYDALGNLATITQPDPSSQNPSVTSTYYYDGLGRLTRFDRPDESGVEFSYAGLAKTIREIAPDGSGGSKTQVFDPLGRLIELQEHDPDAPDAITRYTYDANDNLSRIVNADGDVTTMAHDWVGDRVSITRGGRTWRYAYDLNGNLIEEVPPSGGEPVRYTYDDLDRLLTARYADPVIDALPEGPPSPPEWKTFLPLIARSGGALADVAAPTPATAATPSGLAAALGRTGMVVMLLSPLGALGLAMVALCSRRRRWWLVRGMHLFVALGLILTSLPPLTTRGGAASANSAPAVEIPLGETATRDRTTDYGTVTITYVYDEGANGVGRLSRVALPFGQVSYTYEARGLTTREERSFALTGIAEVNATRSVERAYNALGLPTRSIWDDGQQWQITYDARALVDTVEWFDPGTSAWEAVADYSRGLTGLPHTRDTDYGQVRSFGYDVLGRPTDDSVTLAGGGDPIAERAYAYTDAGDLAAVTGQTNGVSADASYTYDAHHRLLTADGPNGYRGAFSYSPAGNILTAAVDWSGSNETRAVGYEYGTVDPQAVDRLVKAGDGQAYAAFRYDLSGNMTWRQTLEGGTALTWDGLDRLRLAHSPDGGEVYLYDHNGTRMLAVSRQEGVRFWFAESETHYTLEGTQTKRYLHLSGGGPTLARVENGATLELQYADALQNLMFSLDPDGDVTASFLYGPFGEVVYSSGEQEHRRQFNGKENDAVTGLRYYGYRYYDPLALRWNSADPLYRFVPDLGQNDPQRMNLYAFSLNNPVRYYDPDGRDVWTEDDDPFAGSPVYGGPYCDDDNITRFCNDESDSEEEEDSSTGEDSGRDKGKEKAELSPYEKEHGETPLSSRLRVLNRALDAGEDPQKAREWFLRDDEQHFDISPGEAHTRQCVDKATRCEWREKGVDYWYTKRPSEVRPQLIIDSKGRQGTRKQLQKNQLRDQFNNNTPKDVIEMFNGIFGGWGAGSPRNNTRDYTR